jgi:molybdopterin synthase catalytic subunit
MNVAVSILDGPLPRPSVDDDARCPGAGTVLIFEGVVREREGDKSITALDYTTYDPMAERTLARLAQDIAARFGLLAVRVAHSRGRVPVGACSFRLLVAAPHRKEALAAMDEFIDRLKRDIPIWKKPVNAATGEPQEP